MVELTVVFKNGHKWVQDYYDMEEAERVARNFSKFPRSVEKVDLEEWEDYTDIEEGFASNCHCDTYGICGGTSCSQYWTCHMPCK